jgi:hypothetical protein
MICTHGWAAETSLHSHRCSHLHLPVEVCVDTYCPLAESSQVWPSILVFIHTLIRLGGAFRLQAFADFTPTLRQPPCNLPRFIAGGHWALAVVHHGLLHLYSCRARLTPPRKSTFQNSSVKMSTSLSLGHTRSSRQLWSRYRNKFPCRIFRTRMLAPPVPAPNSAHREPPPSVSPR